MFFPPNATTCPQRFRGPPPGCDRSVTDFWGWDTYREQLRCPCDVSDDIYERGLPGGALNLNSTRYPDHGRYGDLHLQWKIPTAEPLIEFGTSWLAVRSSDHKTTRLVIIITNVYVRISAIYPVSVKGFPSCCWYDKHLNTKTMFLVDKNLFALLH
jgi:hypothetical protein